MPRFNVRPEKEAALVARMLKLGIKEEEFEESFVRSSGPGGQNLNKTSTCVVLRHRPTDLMVKVQKSRSQNLNRFLARRLLIEKIATRLGQKSAQTVAATKRAKQKATRKRKTKRKSACICHKPGDEGE